MEKIRNIEFDCAIMSVNLPEMKGYDAVSIIKMIDPKIEIIMTAEENSMELEAKVRRQNIFYYHIKSFDLQELKLAVRDVFKKSERVKGVVNIHGPVHILVVDDDVNFVKAIKTILESKGYEVDCAFSRLGAVEKINESRPDLILLDTTLEKIDGRVDLYKKLQDDHGMKKIPVLAVSSAVEKTDFNLIPGTCGEYLEADDYIVKPVKAANLLKRVEKLIQLKT